MFFLIFIASYSAFLYFLVRSASPSLFLSTSKETNIKNIFIFFTRSNKNLSLTIAGLDWPS